MTDTKMKTMEDVLEAIQGISKDGRAMRAHNVKEMAGIAMPDVEEESQKMLILAGTSFSALSPLNHSTQEGQLIVAVIVGICLGRLLGSYPEGY